MPTYEYACANGHRIEVTQRIDDPSPTTCDQCGAPLRKVFHPAGIVFKGSGFYATDSRSKPAAKQKDDAKKGEPKEKAASGGTDTSSGETGGKKGPEKKSDAKPSDGKTSE